MKRFLIYLFALLFLISLNPLVKAEISITATNGSAAAIQAAVDQVNTQGGGDVFIPEGVWNFINPGEDWKTVEVPATVNIFGATPIDVVYDETNQTSYWKTILRLPFEVQNTNYEPWFRITGTENPNENTRFANMALVGYRDMNQSSAATYPGIVVHNVIDFRIDHCLFRNIGGNAIGAHSTYAYWQTSLTRGVVDHCKFINTAGSPNAPETSGYGVAFHLEWHNDIWDPNIDNVLGRYDRTVFIEDNYFSQWRHCASANNGAHYVFRHNVVKYDYGFGSIDAHGASTPTNQGTRAIEVYENEFLDPLDVPDPQEDGIYFRGGGGVIFNNHFRDYNWMIIFWDESSDPTYHPHDLWIWNNTLENMRFGMMTSYMGTQEEGVDYFLYEKSGYIPYPYPHPLTIEATNTLSGRLLDANNQPVQSEISVYIEDTDTLITSGQTDTSGSYDLQIQPGVFDIAYRILDTGFYVPNFYLRLSSINMSAPLQNILKSITSYTADRKVGFTLNVSESQRIRTHSHMKPTRVLINGTLLSEVPSLSALTDNTWYYDSAAQTLHIIVSPLVSVTAASGSVHDIQAAVDQVAAAGGGTVYIPAGIWFLNATPHHQVEIPGGVNIFGDADPPQAGQKGNGTIRTILKLPEEEPDPSLPASEFRTTMFNVHGENGLPVRISGIHFIGRVDPEEFPGDWWTSTGDTAVRFSRVKDFRVDNCRFEGMGGSGVSVNDDEVSGTVESQGVVDHCSFINLYKIYCLNPERSSIPYADTTSRGYAYGVAVRKAYYLPDCQWESDISKILGKYDGNVYVEDCFFTGCRHNVMNFAGGIYVARHNVMHNGPANCTYNVSVAFHMIDQHPARTATNAGRSMEIYGNQIYQDHPTNYPPGVPHHRIMGLSTEGGGGVVYNNTFGPNLGSCIRMGCPETDDPILIDRCKINGFYIWDNTFTESGMSISVQSCSREQPVENEHYFLRPPNIAEDGFDYTHYPYPHPLTLED